MYVLFVKEHHYGNEELNVYSGWELGQKGIVTWGGLEYLDCGGGYVRQHIW